MLELKRPSVGKSLNVPTHLHVAPREPHGWGSLGTGCIRSIRSWGGAKYGLGKGYVEEEAP